MSEPSTGTVVTTDSNNDADSQGQRRNNNNIQEEREERRNDNYIESVPSLKKECDCCCECCNSWGEEVIYGITFLGRLIMTLYSFHALFFIYNFFFQFILLIPSLLYITDSVVVQVIVIIIYFFFAILSSNIIVIPTYDFLLFPFLSHRNILAHLESLRITTNIINDNDNTDLKKIELKKSKFWLDVFLFLIETAYIVGFFLGFSSETIKIKDVIRVIILFIIYLYYLLIFFSYIIISCNLMVNLFSHAKKKYNDCFKSIFSKFDEIINDFFEPKKPLPQISLFTYAINPLLKKSDDGQIDGNDSCCKCEECFYTFKNIIKLIVFILSLIIAIIIAIIQGAVLTGIFCFFFFIFMLILSLMINFPYVFRNKRTFGIFISPKNYYKKDYKMGNPIMVSFVRLICFVIILFVSAIIILSFIFFKEKNSLDKIKGITFSTSTIEKDSSSLLPNICFSSIHSLNINLFLPFINDAYYYDESIKSPDIKSSLEIQGYKDLFFDDNYVITVGNNLIQAEEGKDSVKMIQYDVQIGAKEITILSIKGTSNKKDVYLDLQLYFPSVLLNLLSMFSLFSQQKDTYSFGYMEYGLSIPYRIFSQYLVIDEYLKDLLKAYNDNKPNFKSNIIIVGHSLGGGLCKILGRLLGKQAISLSGPGVNAFNSLWDYEGSSENFEISAIDLVPDMDLVPRVEVSGGTIYRIACKEGPFDCHSKELSLCEVLIMCQNPNYKEYCINMAGLNEGQIDAILKSVQLNNEK